MNQIANEVHLNKPARGTWQGKSFMKRSRRSAMISAWTSPIFPSSRMTEEASSAACDAPGLEDLTKPWRSHCQRAEFCVPSGTPHYTR